MIVTFDSVAKLCDRYEELRLQNTQGPRTVYHSDEILRKGYTGDPSLVPEAEKYLQEVDTAIDTPRLAWSRSPAGAFCSVPDVLAGLPTPMRRRVHTPDETAPITIIVGTASSSGFKAADFLKRGVVIVALVMALSRVRPINLFIMDPSWGPKESHGETVILARINTTPLDLATACYVLTRQSFTTQVAYLVEYHITGRITWPQNYMENGSARYYRGLTSRMNLEQKDTLIIGDAYLYDNMITEPVKWLKNQVKNFLQHEED